jgi:hypothetical protein
MAIPAHANDITLFGGAQQPGKLTLQSATGAFTTFNPATFGTFGVRFAIGRIVGTEQTFSYSPNFISSNNSAFMYYGNLIVQAPGVVRPYVTAGLGTAFIGGSAVGAITGAKFGVNYGGGLKLMFAGPVGLQFDARGHTLFSVPDDSVNVLEVSMGIVFSF